MNKGKILGIILLLLLISGGAVYRFIIMEGGDEGGIIKRSPKKISINGYIGSEKSNFFSNEEVKKLLLKRYGLEINFRKAGSLEMIGMDHADKDFLWPSSQVALELYKSKHGGSVKSEIIFNSPIVLYSWETVVLALKAKDLTSLASEGHQEIDLKKIIDLVLSDTSWKEMGLDQLYNGVVITSTDPGKSNSGNLFAGLTANLLLGSTATLENLPEVLPDLKKMFLKQGMMEHSTGTLFERYLELGLGSFPLVVGYENQIVEFALQNPDFWPKVKGLMVLLYPNPTVFSEHPLIALTEGGERLITALSDEEIMDIAWRQHGFRTGITNDPSELGIQGIPDRITRIIRMPMPDVMEKIVEELQ